jgi:hypothetical protein
VCEDEMRMFQNNERACAYVDGLRRIEHDGVELGASRVQAGHSGMHEVRPPARTCRTCDCLRE